MQLHIRIPGLHWRIPKVELGKSHGFDCIDDNLMVSSVGELLNRLTLAGTTLPRASSVSVRRNENRSMGCSGGRIFPQMHPGKPSEGKVQLAPWWFNDQQYGIARQFCRMRQSVSGERIGRYAYGQPQFYLLSRHELYRKLCNYSES